LYTIILYIKYNIINNTEQLVDLKF